MRRLFIAATFLLATAGMASANSAPVLNPTPSPSFFFPIPEDAGVPSGRVGSSVEALAHFMSPFDQWANLSDADPGALGGIAVIATDESNGKWFYSTNFCTNWFLLGAVSVTNARLLSADHLSWVYFQPNSNFNGFLATPITFRAWDRTSGTVGGMADTTLNGGTNAFSIATDTASLTISPSNDAPVLDENKNPTFNPIEKDSGNPVGAVGTLISSLVDFASPVGGVDNVTDIDSGALLGIALISANTSSGTWFYSTNGGGVWNSLGSVSSSSARLLAANANNRLYFRPNAGITGPASVISFRAWDQTSGAEGTLANPSVNGGTTAFSTAIDSVLISVIASPLLRISRVNTNALISWTNSATGFRLESNADLSNTNGWATAPQARSTNAGTISVTVPASAGNSFYRLKNP